MSNQPPLIAHIIFKLDFGGLENGLVNLINRIPESKYRHVIICLDTFTDFKDRITRDDVKVIALNKQPGKDLGVFVRLWKVLRQLKPTITHTRNLATIDMNVVGLFAGVSHRIHGEHGRDIYDLDGSNVKYQKLRRILSPFIHRFVPLSQDLEQWLVNEVGINAKKIRRVCNGVDMTRFSPDQQAQAALPAGCPFADSQLIRIGTVGRMQPVKDPLNLVQAFIKLVEMQPALRSRVRLMMAGDGGLRADAQKAIDDAGLTDIAWLPGARNDVPEWLNALDIFALPSLAEGISNTILESMASGLPVVATGVGGNGELVVDGKTGALVPAADPAALAKAIERYVVDDKLRATHGAAGRARCEKEFSMQAMVDKYLAVYDELTG